MYKCLMKIDCQSVVFTNSKWEKECVLLSAQGEVHTCLLLLSTIYRLEEKDHGTDRAQNPGGFHN